jgi:Secretion system C-terminal sorting domain
MKKLTTILLLALSMPSVFAATYRTYVGHYIYQNTYTILVDSDTAFGETGIAQLCYTPSGGGGTAYTGFVDGVFDIADTYPGANWIITISVPAGATNIMLELATENQSGNPYGWTGCNISLSNVLAVELLNFEASVNTKKVQLAWITSIERNNSHFEVERSTNGIGFTKLGKVDAKDGLEGTENTYTFVDEQPLSGVNYYRLKFVERTGTLEYSAVKAVIVGKSIQQILAYPNPTNAILTAEIELEAEDELIIQVIDMLGRTQMLQQQTGMKGANTVRVNTENLPVGHYCLSINGATTRFERK